MYIEADCNKDSAPEHSPYYKMVIEPFIKRIEQLASVVQISDRPPQPGDNELKKIYDDILSNKN